jgi:predicted membrane-bound mannosyltransferase
VCKREEPRQVVPDSPAMEPENSTAVVRRKSASKLPKMVDVWSLDPEKSQDRRAMLGYYTSVLAVLVSTERGVVCLVLDFWIVSPR